MINAIRFNNGVLQVQTDEYKTWQDVPAVNTERSATVDKVAYLTEQRRALAAQVTAYSRQVEVMSGVEHVLRDENAKLHLQVKRLSETPVEVRNLRAELNVAVDRNARLRMLLVRVRYSLLNNTPYSPGVLAADIDAALKAD